MTEKIKYYLDGLNNAFQYYHDFGPMDEDSWYMSLGWGIPLLAIVTNEYNREQMSVGDMCGVINDLYEMYVLGDEPLSYNDIKAKVFKYTIEED